MADKTNPLDFAGSRSALIKRITMITIGANLLFICLAGFSLRQSWLRYEERAGLSTQNLAHVFAAQIGDAVDKIDLTVLTVADEVEKQLAGGGIDANSLNAFIARCQARLPMLDGLRVVNAQGENAYGTDVTPGVRVSVADRAYYLRLRNDPNAGLVISEPVVGRVSKKWSIIFARRVNKPDSSFAGVVYGAVTLKQFTKTFSTVNVGKHGALTLRNEDLALIVRYPEPANIDNEIGKKNASPEYQNAIREQKDEGNYRTNQAFDKIQRTYSFRKVPDHPFYISAGLAPDEFFATWWSEAIWISSLAMFFIFGTFFSAWLAYRGWLSNANAVQSLAREKEALRKSETLLTEAQRIARMGNWELDLQTNKLAWSDEVFQIFEIDKAKFGASWEAFLVAIHPEDRDVVNAAFKQSLETRTPCKINHRLLMPDGRIKHVQPGRWKWENRRDSLQYPKRSVTAGCARPKTLRPEKITGGRSASKETSTCRRC